MKTKIILFLDDIRDPDDKPWLETYSPIRDYQNCVVIWVKNYHSFVEWIKNNGLPDAVMFDHDLGGDVQREKRAKGMSKTQAKKERRGTPSGMDCAKWLVEYCLENKLKLPVYGIQSANPAGKENIDGLLKSFIKHQQQNQ